MINGWFHVQASRAGERRLARDVALYEKKAWEIAKSPFKNLFFYAFMLYMTGSRLSVFSIFILIPVLSAPVASLMNVNKAFEMVDVPGVELGTAKLLYVALNLAGMAMGLYKIHVLGLLPVTSADWISLLTHPKPVEHSAGAVATWE